MLSLVDLHNLLRDLWALQTKNSWNNSILKLHNSNIYEKAHSSHFADNILCPYSFVVKELINKKSIRLYVKVNNK